MLCTILTALRVSISTTSWSLQPRLPLSFTVTTSPSLVVKTWSRIAPFSLTALSEGRCHQCIPGSSPLPVPCCAVSPTDIGVVEVPHEDQVLWSWCCSIYKRPHPLNVLGWAACNRPHSNSTPPCPPFNSEALYLVLIHAQEELHSLQLATDIQVSTVTSSLLPVLPKEPVSFHSDILVIVAISPHMGGQ